MLLLYRERGYMYEPILYKHTEGEGDLKTVKYKHIIGSHGGNLLDDCVVSMDTIKEKIRQEVVKFANDRSKDNKDQLINIGQLSIILDDCQLNGNKLKIHKHVYDYYNKITHAINKIITMTC